MCDTFVRVEGGEVLFGKNSNRDPNEAQRIEWHPRRTSAEGAIVRATWITIPDVRRTHATLLSRPYWMWGAEMGANEHGVVIGNEAVFTRGVRRERSGLLGMDLVRLALERAESADEAASVIEALLAEHGQAGRAGYDDPSFHYDSSFLVADARGAWVVETAGRESARERVTSGVRAISNGLTIPHIARRHADRLRGRVAECSTRRARVEQLAHAARSPEDAARVLRDHGAQAMPHYRWTNGMMSAPCMHAGGVLARSQTVASWISRLTANGAEHFATATAAPCLSGYKQIDLGTPLDLGAPTGIDDGATPYWKFERLHRALVGNRAGSVEHQRARNAWEASTWRGGRDPREAFTSFDTLVSESVRAHGAPADERPRRVRAYWSGVEADARALAPKLPSR